MKCAFAMAIGVALLVCAPVLAFAKPRVAIVELDGDTASELQDTIAEVLEETFIIIGPRQVSRTIVKLGFDTDLSTKQLKKLSAELEADVIIRGELKKKNGRRGMHLRLVKDGQKGRGFRTAFANARSRKFKDALRDKLLDTVGDGSGAGEPVADETPPPDDETPAEGGGETPPDDEENPVAETPAKPARPGKPGKSKKKVATGDDEEQTEGESEGEPALPPGTRTLNRDAVRVDIGVSVSQRNLHFTSRAFEEAPKDYSNTPVPGARLQLELYPFAFGNPNSIAAGLGIGGDYDQTLALNLRSNVQPGTTFPVKQSHWSLNGRFRVVFGKKATSPSAVFRAGYVSRSFVVDRSALMEGNIIDLPDVGYKGYTGGADVRFPVSPMVALFGGASGVFVTTTGNIQSREQYGQAKVTGVEATLGVDIALGRRYAIRAAADLAQMGFAFTGNGEMARNRDGDPSTKDIGGAADRFLGGSVLFGVFY